MPTPSSSAPATPARAHKFSPLTIVLFLLAGLGVISLINGFALPKMLFRSAVDRGDDISTGNRAVEEAVGRQHLRQVKQMVQAIDNDQITDPGTLRSDLDPVRENTKKMEAVARGENPGSNPPPPAPTCTQNIINGADGSIQIEIQPQCMAGYRPGLYKGRETKEFTVDVVPLDNKPAPPTVFINGDNSPATYDDTTHTLTAERGAGYKLQESGRHLIVRLVPKN